jgi:O-antigen ligase
MAAVGLLLLADLALWRLADAPHWLSLTLCPLAAAALVAGRKLALPPAGWLLAAFAGWSLLSGFWAYSPSQAFGAQVKLGVAFAAFLIAWVCARHDQRNIRIVLATLLAFLSAGALLSLETASTRLLLRPLIGLMAASSPELAAAYGTWTGTRLLTLTNPNTAAPLAMAGVLIAAWFFTTTASRRVRVAAAAAGILLAFEFALCLSLGSIIVSVPVLALAALLAPKGGKLRRLGLLGAGCLAGALLALPFFLAVPGSGEGALAATGDKAATAGERLAFYRDALTIAGESPVIGQGMGVFEARELQVQDAFRESKYVHSQYLQTLDEGGIVGLALLLGVLVLAFMRLWKLRASPKGQDLAAFLGPALLLLFGHAAVDIDLSISANLAVTNMLLAVALALAPEPAAKSDLPKVANAAARLVSWAVLAATAWLSVGQLAALAEIGKLSTDAPVSQADLRRSVAAALALDPLHRADYWNLYVTDAVAQGYSAQDIDTDYVQGLEGFTDRSVIACGTMMNYDLSQNDLEGALLHIRKLALVRPLDRDNHDMAVSYAYQLLDQVEGDQLSQALVQDTLDWLGGR